MKPSYQKSAICFIAFLFAHCPCLNALEVQILGPSGTTLAPNTEYSFGLWIRNPGASGSNPSLELLFSGAEISDYSVGTFEGGGSEMGRLELESRVLPHDQGLIGYVVLCTETSGELRLELNGSIDWSAAADEKTYTIAELTGDAWAELSSLAASRAVTNADFASLYRSLCNNTASQVAGNELFGHAPESLKHAVQAGSMLVTLLAGIFDPAGAIFDLLLEAEQQWLDIPDFLGVFTIWDYYVGALDRYTWYFLFLQLKGYSHTLAAMPYSYPASPMGYLELIADKEIDESGAWNDHDAIIAFHLLKSQESYIDQAVSMAEDCIDEASENNDTQGHGFFTGLKIHLETEDKLVDELKQIALALNPPAILDDSETQINPTTALAGGTLTLYYHIHNPFSEGISAWLGATITKYDGSGIHFHDPLHDTVRTMAPDDHVYERQFAVPGEAPSGSYRVSWGLHSGRIIGEGIMWDLFSREATLTVVRPGTPIEVTCSTDKELYNPLEAVHLSADLSPPLTGASVSYVTKDRNGAVVKSGTCSDNGGGNYSVSLIAPNMTGDYTVEVTASMSGCVDGADSSDFSVEYTGGLGHDVGIETVYWDPASAIRPYAPHNDVIASIGEHAIVQAVKVRNYGDYREDVEVRMEIVNQGGGVVTGKSDSIYLSVNAHDTLLYFDEKLDVGTSGMDDGVYTVRIKTVISGDGNPTNNAQTWQIIVGTPGPEPGHLPFQSYRWYRHNYTGSLNSTTASIGIYSVAATYLTDSSASFYLHRSGWSASDQIIQRGAGPYDFDTGKLIVYLAGCSKAPGPEYLLSFYVGVADGTFEQDTPFQTKYGYGGARVDVLDIPSRYQARFDFYLPPGDTIGAAYLKGYNPYLDKTTVWSYIRAWRFDGYRAAGTAYDTYGGTRFFKEDIPSTSPGAINDHYVAIPSASMPRGDYNFLIIQHRETSTSGDGTYEVGYAHSLRLRVLQYRDLALSDIELPATMVSGNQYEIDVGVDNKGDIMEEGVAVGLVISGPAGYSTALEETGLSIGYQGHQAATFHWDTNGLGGGEYTFVATTTIPDDVNTANNTVVTVGTLAPPPLPPLLNIAAVCDHNEYAEGGVVDMDIFISIDESVPIEGVTVKYTITKEQETLHAGTATEVGGGAYSAAFHAPIWPDVYACRISASKLGYREGVMDISLKVIDTTGPSVPQLLSTANGARVNPIGLVFDWLDAADAGSGISGYELQVDQNDTFAAPDVNTTTSNSSCSSVEQLDDGEYYWHVRAVDNAGNIGGWSSTYMFTVDSDFPDIDSQKDGEVNFRDFAVLASHWQETCNSTNWVEDDPCNIYVDEPNSMLYWRTDNQQRSAYDTCGNTLAVGDIVEFEYKYLNHSDSNTRQRVWFGFTDGMPFTEPFADNFIGGAAVNNWGDARFEIGIRKGGEWIYRTNFTTSRGVPVVYKTMVEVLSDTQFKVNVIRDMSSEVLNETVAGDIPGLAFERCAVWNEQIGSGLIQGWYEGHLNYIKHETAAGGYEETFDGKSTYCEGAELDGNGTVDFTDFEIFAREWLEGAIP